MLVKFRIIRREKEKTVRVRGNGSRWLVHPKSKPCLCTSTNTKTEQLWIKTYQVRNEGGGGADAASSHSRNELLWILSASALHRSSRINQKDERYLVTIINLGIDRF